MMQERKSFFSRYRLKFLLAIFLVLTALIGVRLAGEWRKRQEIQDEVGRLEEEAKRLENRNLEILELSKELTSEEFLEREARLKLGLQKPGETVAVVGVGSGTEEPVVKREVNASRKGNAKRWYYYFFDQDRLNALREERKTRRSPNFSL